MKKFTSKLSTLMIVTVLMVLGTTLRTNAQSYTMSTANCQITSNAIFFDAMVTNNGTAPMNLNSVVIRMTHGTGFLPATGTNTVAFAYVNDGQSIIPNSFPPTNTPAFTYTAAARQFQVSTGTSVYLNGTCNAPGGAPNLPIGVPMKIGRFSLTLSNSQGLGFVPGSSAALAWSSTAACVVYMNCSSTTSLATALTKSLATPCSLTAPNTSCALTASVASFTNVTCNGGTNGTATATSTGAVGAVSYSWNTSPAQLTATATNLAAGSYVVTATDAANSCTSTASVTITQPTAVVASSSSTPVLCNGGSSEVTISASGGTGPYTGTGTFTQSAGTQTYTVTDANGCTGSTTVTITQPTPVVVTPSFSPIACNGGMTAVTISASGGTGPYTGTGTFNQTAGTDVYTVTDANGCTGSATVTLTEPTAVVASSSATPILCNGGSSTVTVSASGGTGPYTGTGTFTSGAGTQTYTVTDANGCTATTTITITEPTALSLSTSSTPTSTPVSTDGTATVNPSGGTSPYSYSWSNGQTTQTATGLAAGSYNVTVTDANGCTASTSVTVSSPGCTIGVSATATATSCFGGSNGSITAVATGANGVVTYSISPGSATNNSGVFNGLTAGSYTITATDESLCSASTSATVSQPTAVVVSANFSPIACNGGMTAVTISATGGTGPYTGTGTFNQTAGTDVYTVTDANGCTGSTTVTLTQPTAVSVTASSTPTSTPVSSDGTATANPSGGTPGYTYSWSNGQTTQTATGLAAGSYTVTVTDANGCTASTSVTVTAPGCTISLSATATNTSCFGGNNGSITAVASGANGTVTYEISPGSATNITGVFNGLTAGTYTITATDAANCSTNTTATVQQPTQVVASSSSTPILCNGGSSTVTVSATGGTGPYTGTGTFTRTSGTWTFTVTDANGCTATTTITITEPTAVSASSSSTPILCNGGSSTVTVSATGGTGPYTGTGAFTRAAGTWTFTVTDANGCTATTTITITEPTAVSASSSSTPILCNGGSSTVTVSATGGTGPYTGTGTFSVTAGTYTYTVTDANGCTGTTTITVTQPTAVVASSSSTPILCNGGNSTVTVSATGGTAPYSGTGTFTRAAGTWTFTVTDANGCTATTTITITQPTQLVANNSVGAPILCFGGTTSVTIGASGGTAPYTGTGTFSQGAGTQTYTVTDANGCTATTTVTLTQPTKVEGTTTTTPASGCATPDGSATVTPTGGSGSYTYLWSNGQTTQTAVNLVAGTYTVTITDGNGCTGSASATVLGSGGSVGTPGPVTGPEGACRNTSGIVYSVAPVVGATSYTWTLPSGVTGSSTTNSITVAFGGQSFVGGFICVVANNACGSSSPSCLNVPVITTYPGLPSVITGPGITCGPGTYTFSTNSTNATSYNWVVTGTGVTIVNGLGTNTIQVSVPAGFSQGSIQVRGVNCNGTSAVRGMTITGIPAHSNAVSGPSFVCAGGTATYSMPVVPGVTTYTWSIAGDAILASQNLTSTTSSGTFNFGPTWNGGTVSITVSNSCGSYTRTFAVRSTPIQPGGITGPGTAVCGQSNVTYSIAAVAGATSYTWTVPPGVSLVSTSPDGLTIVVNFTAGFTNTGNICVTANNACGQGPARCYAITARPGVPVITGPTSVCKTQSAVTYNIAPVTGATSYSWSITGGASINPSGTSAIVNYNTSLSSSAVLRANANNACGASQPGALSVAVNLFCRTAAEEDASINSAEFSTYPNPTSAKTTVSFSSVSKMKYTVKVADLLGNTLYVDVINASEGYNSKEINMTDYAKGVYVVSLTADDGNTQSKRVVVE